MPSDGLRFMLFDFSSSSSGWSAEQQVHTLKTKSSPNYFGLQSAFRLKPELLADALILTDGEVMLLAQWVVSLALHRDRK